MNAATNPNPDAVTKDQRAPVANPNTQSAASVAATVAAKAEADKAEADKATADKATADKAATTVDAVKQRSEVDEAAEAEAAEAEAAAERAAAQRAAAALIEQKKKEPVMPKFEEGEAKTLVVAIQPIKYRGLRIEPVDPKKNHPGEVYVADDDLEWLVANAQVRLPKAKTKA